MTRAANYADASDRERIARAHDALAAALDDATPVDLGWIDPPPEHDGWTLAPDALRLVHRLIGALRPAHVMEFGAGLSTRMMLRACGDHGLRAAITSIDHDPRFGGVPAGEPRRDVVGQVAPLVACDFGGKLLPAYLIDTMHVGSRAPADLVLIDGPPEVLGGREGVLYQAMPFARPGTVVLLDDANRAAERNAMAHWRDVLGDAIDIRVCSGFTKGLAAIVIAKVVLPDELWSVRNRQARAALGQMLAPGERYVLADRDRADAPWSSDPHALPLFTRDGVSWDVPANDDEAIAEIPRWLASGAKAFVTLWPSFWWREHYAAFFARLDARFRRVVDDDCVLAYRLDEPHQP